MRTFKTLLIFMLIIGVACGGYFAYDRGYFKEISNYIESTFKKPNEGDGDKPDEPTPDKPIEIKPDRPKYETEDVSYEKASFSLDKQFYYNVTQSKPDTEVTNYLNNKITFQAIFSLEIDNANSVFSFNPDSVLSQKINKSFDGNDCVISLNASNNNKLSLNISGYTLKESVDFTLDSLKMYVFQIYSDGTTSKQYKMEIELADYLKPWKITVSEKEKEETPPQPITIGDVATLVDYSVELPDYSYLDHIGFDGKYYTHSNMYVKDDEFTIKLTFSSEIENLEVYLDFRSVCKYHYVGEDPYFDYRVIGNSPIGHGLKTTVTKNSDGTFTATLSLTYDDLLSEYESGYRRNYNAIYLQEDIQSDDILLENIHFKKGDEINEVKKVDTVLIDDDNITFYNALVSKSTDVLPKDMLEDISYENFKYHYVNNFRNWNCDDEIHGRYLIVNDMYVKHIGFTKKLSATPNQEADDEYYSIFNCGFELHGSIDFDGYSLKYSDIDYVIKNKDNDGYGQTILDYYFKRVEATSWGYTPYSMFKKIGSTSNFINCNIDLSSVNDRYKKYNWFLVIRENWGVIENVRTNIAPLVLGNEGTIRNIEQNAFFPLTVATSTTYDYPSASVFTELESAKYMYTLCRGNRGIIENVACNIIGFDSYIQVLNDIKLIPYSYEKELVKCNLAEIATVKFTEDMIQDHLENARLNLKDNYLKQLLVFPERFENVKYGIVTPVNPYSDVKNCVLNFEYDGKYASPEYLSNVEGSADYYDKETEKYKEYQKALLDKYISFCEENKAILLKHYTHENDLFYRNGRDEMGNPIYITETEILNDDLSKYTTLEWDNTKVFRYYYILAKKEAEAN